MATHHCRTKTNAKAYAKRMRSRGYNASIGKVKNGWNVYVSRRK